MKNSRFVASLLVVLLPGMVSAQQEPAAMPPQAQPSANTAGSTHLEQRLDQVLAALNGMQHQLDDSKQQIDQLHHELEEVRAQLAAANAETPAATAEAASQLQNSVQQLQDQGEILQAEVKQHDQTKVESASKYPVKINGLLLFSSFLNDGAVDNIDLPIVALPRTAAIAHGSLGATMRQTILGLEAKGPTLWGARSSGDFHVDFFGGVPYADYTTTTGTLRLRTAHARLDWANHSLIAALDAPLVSPLEPTSYVGLGEPPFAWSGNLWIWLPQVESLNRTRLGAGTLSYDFSLVDPAAPGNPATSGERQPDPAERSRQPGYESRVSYSFPLLDRYFTVGAGGYYSRQTYPNSQHVDAWAGTADWKLPLARRLELSGEFYRGRSLGGLGGGTFKDYVTDPDSGEIYGLNDEGGWAQLKTKITRSLEVNAGFGEDAGFSQVLRYYIDPTATDAYTNLARNRTVLANIVYRPKTYLLFSAEYRNIYSWPITGSVNTSQSLGLATGYSF
jgi:Skp family chaperone for outer membrane proteins